jgi:deoxycytidylate deaminase
MASSQKPAVIVIQLLDLDGNLEHPELFFGVVAAVGTPLDESFVPHLIERLKTHGYTDVPVIRVSDLLKDLNLKSQSPQEHAREYDRLSMLMNRGDELRKETGRPEALALLATATIRARRPSQGDRKLPRQAFIIRQLKHRDEVLWLRHTYGSAFYLIGLYSPHASRKAYLKTYRDGMSDTEAEHLMKRDEEEDEPTGQQVRQTFHLADVFIETSSTASVYSQVDRFVDLLFGQGFVSPTKHEYGMYLAHAAALRSLDLSRQVGAAILDDQADVLALGTNEVPAAKGGQYWGEEGEPDHRDYKDKDFNEFKKREIIQEIIERLEAMQARVSGGTGYTAKQREEFIDQLESTRIADLIEFGRAVHAEMEALLSAVRRGISVRDTRLYTTTFPCHNCAKHIVGAGIRQVFYIEPYPKSLAGDMYPDSIGFTDLRGLEDGTSVRIVALPRDKVWFTPFVGIAPRRYSALFSNLSEHGERKKRKEKGGGVSNKPMGLRQKGPILSYLEREELAAQGAAEVRALLG